MRAGSHAPRRRGAHAQSNTSPGGAGDPALGGGGRSARAAAADRSGLGGCCSAQRPGPAGAGSSMCRGSSAAAAAAPLQQRQQQRPPWPSPARSSPASCKVRRGCGGLRDAPSGSIPDPVRSSPRHTPAPPAPNPMHPGCKAAPCIPARSISVPGASSAALLASPCQDLPVPEPPVPIFGDRCSPLALPRADSRRSWPTPRRRVQFPLTESPGFPTGRSQARPAARWELPLVLTAP